MKRTDLEKLQGKKVVDRMRREPTAARYGSAAAEAGSRRDQRDREKAAGLVPFAVKLPAALVATLQERARSEATGLNELVAALLDQALRAPTDTKASLP